MMVTMIGVRGWKDTFKKMEGMMGCAICYLHFFYRRDGNISYPFHPVTINILFGYKHFYFLSLFLLVLPYRLSLSVL
jgi:hypothetical protein